MVLPVKSGCRSRILDSFVLAKVRNGVDRRILENYGGNEQSRFVFEVQVWYICTISMELVSYSKAINSFVGILNNVSLNKPPSMRLEHHTTNAPLDNTRSMRFQRIAECSLASFHAILSTFTQR